MLLHQAGIAALSVYLEVSPSDPNTVTSLRYNNIDSAAVQAKNTRKKYCTKADTIPHNSGTPVVKPAIKKEM